MEVRGRKGASAVGAQDAGDLTQTSAVSHRALHLDFQRVGDEAWSGLERSSLLERVEEDDVPAHAVYFFECSKTGEAHAYHECMALRAGMRLRTLHPCVDVVFSTPGDGPTTQLMRGTMRSVHRDHATHLPMCALVEQRRVRDDLSIHDGHPRVHVARRPVVCDVREPFGLGRQWEVGEPAFSCLVAPG